LNGLSHSKWVVYFAYHHITMSHGKRDLRYAKFLRLPPTVHLTKPEKRPPNSSFLIILEKLQS
jgi:hypothetical protein